MWRKCSEALPPDRVHEGRTATKPLTPPRIPLNRAVQRLSPLLRFAAGGRVEPPGPQNRLLGLGFRAVRTTGRLPVVWSSWAGTLHPAAVAGLVYCATSQERWWRYLKRGRRAMFLRGLSSRTPTACVTSRMPARMVLSYAVCPRVLPALGLADGLRACDGFDRPSAYAEHCDLERRERIGAAHAQRR